jgi:hypothetical protein
MQLPDCSRKMHQKHMIQQESEEKGKKLQQSQERKTERLQAVRLDFCLVSCELFVSRGASG